MEKRIPLVVSPEWGTHKETGHSLTKDELFHLWELRGVFRLSIADIEWNAIVRCGYITTRLSELDRVLKEIEEYRFNKTVEEFLE